jgi:hypothetical protein
MTIAANRSLRLDAHSAKSKIVIATGAPTVGVNDVAIWFGSSVPQYRSQINLGILKTLQAYLKSNAHNGVTKVHLPFTAGNDTAIVVNGTPGVTSISITVGATLATKQQTHFINRTLTRLFEGYLELAKRV